jgi:hypothetical protein
MLKVGFFQEVGMWRGADSRHRRLPRIARGQWVRVRTEAEILATLDAEGKLEGMPFLPEMTRFFGQTVQVYRRAVKTCVEGNAFRRLHDTVILEGLRCDGAFHEGCQRSCPYFWKEAWLEPAAEPAGAPEAVPPGPVSGTWLDRFPTRREDRFVCQSTELLGATRPLSRWDLTHLLAEIRAGELSLRMFFLILVHTLANRVREALGLRRLGQLAGAREAPGRGDLDLHPGEWVEVRPAEEIRRTLDGEGKNRGLSFEPTMVDFAGGRFEVDYPIARIISEQTGQMVFLTHTVALKGVTCTGLCAKNCPRNNTLYWREAWLRRVERESGR